MVHNTQLDAPQSASADERATGIRSYVLRQGRISPAQQRYRDTMMPRIGLPYVPAPVDLDQIFARHAPRFVEIGFGMGEATATIAATHPENDYLGIEVHSPGVGNLCKLISSMGLRNVRIVQHDAAEVVRDMLLPASLSGVHLFFPDPWPKKRHHKRRLLQPPFVALLAERLRAGAYVHCATDWQDYAAQMLTVLSAEPMLENTGGGYAENHSERPLTKFEQRGRRLGHAVWDLVFRRRNDLIETKNDGQNQLA